MNQGWIMDKRLFKSILLIITYAVVLVIALARLDVVLGAVGYVLGLFRPKILLPFDLAADQAELVIAHEEAHLRRRDHWWKPLGYLILAVYWFQPLIWVAYILLCRDLELACDEAVIGKLSPARRADYSQTLLQCSTAGRLAACPLSFGEVGVRTRVKAVLSYRKPALWILVAAVAVCLVTAICFLTTPPSPLGKITVTAAEVWNIPAEQGYDLSPAELSELQSRLEDLDLGGVMDSYQGFTPLYTMSITDEAGKGYTLSVFNTEGTHAGMLVDGVYYRIEDGDFVAYLMRMAKGKSRVPSQRQMTLEDVRTLAEKGAKALSPKALTGAAALTEQLRTACGFYVGPGHMAGWLGAGLAQLCR